MNANEDALKTMRACVDVLENRGVPASISIGVARTGITMLALRILPDPESVAFREWSDAQPRTPLPTDTPLARYVAEARQHLSLLVVVWQQVAAALDTDGPEIFEHAWGSLDHVEGERLLAGVTS